MFLLLSGKVMTDLCRNSAYNLLFSDWPLKGHDFESNLIWDLTAKHNQLSTFLLGDVKTPDLWHLTEKLHRNEHAMVVGLTSPVKCAGNLLRSLATSFILTLALA